MKYQLEMAEAQMYNTPGNDKVTSPMNQLLTPLVVVDEGYFVVGNHLDETMIGKIGRGEYVDFRKLLSKDKVMAKEDCRFEMMIKKGGTYWVPASNTVAINSFAKWKQAFRVFSNVYCKANPNRSAELIEYNSITHVTVMVHLYAPTPIFSFFHTSLFISKAVSVVWEVL